jgi:hypothetical protein
MQRREKILIDRIRKFKLENPGASINDVREASRSALTESDIEFLADDFLKRHVKSQPDDSLKVSFSYNELMSGDRRLEIENFAETGMLDDKTIARVGHIDRFYKSVGNAMPNPYLKISDVFTTEEMWKFWQKTAPEGADIEPCPMLQ